MARSAASRRRVVASVVGAQGIFGKMQRKSVKALISGQAVERVERLPPAPKKVLKGKGGRGGSFSKPKINRSEGGKT